MPLPVRLGLTGGIGSGKSTVANLLVGLGAGLVDADAISRQLTATGGLAMPAVAAAFGPAFVDASGALQRDRMRQLVHSEPSARQRLEAIIHPLVGQETARQAARFAERMCPCIVFDIPLLVESAHWRLNLDHVLVLDCTAEEQISRVMVRNQLSQSEVEKIISSQASRRLRLAAADSVIFNVGLSLAELEADLRQISPRFGLSSG